MSTIVTRSGKGAALTHAEMDANLTNLNTDKLEVATVATLSNKNIALGSNTISGTTAQFNIALSDGDFSTLAGTEVLTNKTVTLSSNTVTGTTAQFNTALTDNDFATLAAVETLTNKTVLAATNTVEATSGPSGSALGFRNKIINGNFDIWQRGSPVTPALGTLYTADRWGVFSSGAAPATITQGAGVDGASLYSLSVVGAASNTALNLFQRIESSNVEFAYNKTVTISGWVYTSDARNPSLDLSYANATDNFAAVTSIALVSLGSATGWRYFTKQFSVPGVKSGLVATFIFGAALAGVNVALSRIQLEEGSVATPFEYRPIGLELALCQRYYQLCKISVIGYASAGANIGLAAGYKVTMRAAPTIAQASNNADFTQNNVTASTSIYIGADIGAVTVYRTATVLGATQFSEIFTASAEL